MSGVARTHGNAGPPVASPRAACGRSVRGCSGAPGSAAGGVAPDQARRLAQELLGRVAGGRDPAQERADRRGMPTLAEAFDDYLAANPTRKASTVALYRGQMRYCLGDWLSRPLNVDHPPGR